jgi:hypothetical protein
MKLYRQVLALAGLLLPQTGSVGLGRDLAPGLQLVYESNGQEQPAWVVDSVISRLPLLPLADCARIYLRRRPDQLRADESRVCVTRDTLFMWDARSGDWLPRRPVGAGMTMRFPQASGDTVRYSTGALTEEVISGRRLAVVPTTVLTVDSLGRPRRRLRERYSPSLVTATGGVFERPDSAATNGWRVEQAFELRAIRSGPGSPPPQ